ncbi:MAG: glycosyltransferase family 2 protein, partial [Alphaproteobacteria bacterium]|nr:glycosyltransferase family 2 protein [Alphaproteobacteria bacterium]
AVADGLAERYRIRILYAVDPSPDRTELVLRDISARDPRVSVIVMSRRFGHQAALVAGIDLCDGEAVIMLDSDLQHPPELIPALIARWEDGAEIVQTVRQDGSETRLAKRLTSRLFYRTLLKVGSVELTPGAADFRLLSSRVVAVFRSEMREHNPFLRGLVSWVGFNISFVPFVPARREHGRSKYRLSALFNFALNGICSFSNLPLRFCIGVGFVIAGLSLLGAALQLLAYFLGSRAVPGWASLFMFASFIGGIQIMFLGIVGEYVSLIFDEVKARPRYILGRRYERGRLVPERSLRQLSRPAGESAPAAPRETAREFRAS